MKKIPIPMCLLCIITLIFPTMAFANEIYPETNIPIVAESEHIKIFSAKTQYPLKDIIIRETADDAFTQNPHLSFVVKNDFEWDDRYLPFVEDISGSLSKDTLEVEYKTENGKLLVNIKNSDPTIQESFTLSDIVIEKKTVGGVMGTYALFVSTKSHPENTILIPGMIELQEYVPPRETEPLSIRIQLGEDKMLINHTEKKLREPAYLSSNGYVMLPLRDFGSAFTKLEISWYAEQQLVLVPYDEITGMIYPNDTIMKIHHIYTNEDENMPLCNTVEVKNGRTFLALRDICHVYNIPDEDIHWNPDTKTVTIQTEKYVS